eukprot:gene56148-76968_t
MGVPASDILRVRGTNAEALGLTDPAATDALILDAMVREPILVNRPIVVTAKGARLCRPTTMSTPPTPRERAGQIIRDQVAAWDGVPTMDQLTSVLRIAAMWRSTALAQTFMARSGNVVAGGPFAGMAYVSSATEGALIARLLGVYESELHPHFEAFIAEGLDCVIDSVLAGTTRATNHAFSSAVLINAKNVQIVEHLRNLYAHLLE